MRIATLTKFKPHNHILRLEDWPSSPYRVFRRLSMSGNNYAALNFAQQDISDRIIHGNIQNFIQFMDKCQVKFDLSYKVHTMFGGKGLIH